MRIDQTKLTIPILLILLLLAVAFLCVENAKTIYAFLRDHTDDVFLKWVSIFVSFITIIFALTLNIVLEYFRRPRFRIDTGTSERWQKKTKVQNEKEEIIQMHLRFRISNVGSSCEKSAEVRLEKIYKLPVKNGAKPVPLNQHDPRPLKWVGRDTKPIAMNAGIFDFVDLGVRRADLPDRFRLEFESRGHYDLVLDRDEYTGFLVAGTVYGEKAIPKYFQFMITWDPRRDFGPIEIKKYENFSVLMMINLHKATLIAGNTIGWKRPMGKIISW
ncbi:MAG: hypothetical protein JWP44_3765 [Mucilaginibacter sp.]|nr:hypothetical protein [Mucilaginibacter sp.]